MKTKRLYLILGLVAGIFLSATLLYNASQAEQKGASKKLGSPISPVGPPSPEVRAKLALIVQTEVIAELAKQARPDSPFVQRAIEDALSKAESGFEGVFRIPMPVIELPEIVVTIGEEMLGVGGGDAEAGSCVCHQTCLHNTDTSYRASGGCHCSPSGCGSCSGC